MDDEEIWKCIIAIVNIFAKTGASVDVIMSKYK